MIEVSEARERIISSLSLIGTEVVSLPEAVGRVCAIDVSARLSSPPADVSAMDGYALRAEDAQEGSILRVVGEAPAGHPTGAVVQAGACVRVFTGSVIPAGADSVLIQENTLRHETGGDITVSVAPPSGANIRKGGQDFRAGQTVIASGTRLSARHIGLAAAANCPWVTVRRRPRVVILSTGDEIVMPGEAVPSGGIVGSAGLMLAGLLRQAGCDAVMLPTARDTEDDLFRASRNLSGADLVLTIGGASVGAYDLVKGALGQQGLVTDFWKIAMRPGKPLMFGRMGETPVIGLPGNPVAAFVCTLVFALPALRTMQGETTLLPATEPARLAVDLAANDRRYDHLRARLSRDDQGVLWAEPFPVQDSSMLVPLALGDALVLRPPHDPARVKGDVCEVIRLEG